MSRLTTMRLGFQDALSQAIAQPWLNRIKSASAMAGNAGAGNIDASGDYNANGSGYPINMTKISGGTWNELNFGMMGGSNSPYYPSGQWVLKWTGPSGNTAALTCLNLSIDISGSNLTPDSSSSTSTSGRKVYTLATPSSLFLIIRMTGINSSNLISDMAFLPLAHEAAYDAGEIINPDYYSAFQRMTGPVRFMPLWGVAAENGTSGDWCSAPDYIFWGAYNVPIEVASYMASKFRNGVHLCTPALVSDDAVIAVATRLRDGSTDALGRVWPGLASDQHAYIEYFNENFSSYGAFFAATMSARGLIMNPSSPNTTAQKNEYYFARSGAVASIWKDVFTQAGKGSQIIRIQGAQIGTGSQAMLAHTSTEFGALSFTCNGHISGTTLTIDSGLSGTVISRADISGICGHMIQGAGIADQTYVVSGSGSTWTVSKSQTVGSAGSPVSITGKFYFNALGNNCEYIAVAPYLDCAFTPTSEADVWAQNLDGGAPFSGSVTSNVLTATAMNPALRLYPGLPLYDITSGNVFKGTIIEQLTKTVGEWGYQGTYSVTPMANIAAGTDNLGIIPYGQMHQTLGQAYQGQKAAKLDWNVESVCYESGTQFVNYKNGNPTVQSYYYHALEDTRCYDAYIELYNKLEDFGFLYAVHYGDFGGFNEFTNFGIYGTMPNVLSDPATEPFAKKYNALMDLLNPETASGPIQRRMGKSHSPQVRRGSRVL